MYLVLNIFILKPDYYRFSIGFRRRRCFLLRTREADAIIDVIPVVPSNQTVFRSALGCNARVDGHRVVRVSSHPWYFDSFLYNGKPINKDMLSSMNWVSSPTGALICCVQSSRSAKAMLIRTRLTSYPLILPGFFKNEATTVPQLTIKWPGSVENR